MSIPKWPLVACLLVFLCTPFSGSVLAQTTTGILEGTATDTTGAVLRGVAVQVKADTTDRTVVTDSRGFYRVPALPAGTYSLTASLSGFQTIVLKDIVLPVDRTVALDVRMDVAAAPRPSRWWPRCHHWTSRLRRPVPSSMQGRLTRSR